MIVLLVMGNDEGGKCVPYSHSCVNVESVVVVDMEGVAAAAPPPAVQAVVPVDLTVFFN
jgi:hypothetical protein